MFFEGSTRLETENGSYHSEGLFPLRAVRWKMRCRIAISKRRENRHIVIVAILIWRKLDETKATLVRANGRLR
jgi:hypothetical protein